MSIFLNQIKLYIYGVVVIFIMGLGVYVYSLKSEIKTNKATIHRLHAEAVVDEKSVVAVDLSHELEVTVEKVKGIRYEFETNRSIGTHVISFK